MAMTIQPYQLTEETVQTFRQSTDGVHQSLGHAHLLDPDIRRVEEELGDSKPLVVHTDYLHTKKTFKFN